MDANARDHEMRRVAGEGKADVTVLARSFGVLVMALLGACAPYVGHVRSRHAQEFGCQERWVQVRERGEGRWTAIGCGFQSEWVCRERDCEMRDQRSYGMDTP